MLRHEKKIHGPKKASSAKSTPPVEHQCNMCPKKFREKSYLTKHIKRKHQIMIKSGSNLFLRNINAKYTKIRRRKIWTCFSCRKTFSKWYDLLRHNKSIHKVLHSAGEAAVFSCNICGSVCSSCKALTVHKKHEHPKVAFSCQLCNKGFEKNSQLYMHRYFHHSNKEYRCSRGKEFTRKAKLKIHQLKHCGRALCT